MNVQNQEIPQPEIETHRYFDESMRMYIVVGQSDALGFLMSDYLYIEITRGLWWFWLSLLGGVFICFLVFWIITERRLYAKVTKPIQALDHQIKNPKEFMA